MLTLGIDVVIMSAFGFFCVLVALITSALIPLSQEEGEAVVYATAGTVIAMNVAYIIMCDILNAML